MLQLLLKLQKDSKTHNNLWLMQYLTELLSSQVKILFKLSFENIVSLSPSKNDK